jgi:DNA modification methylase
MINELHLMDNQEGIAKLPDKSVNLIIADPPYYKIKGDFDFEFKDFQEYLNFMEEQAKLYKRVLADNGSLFVYGHAKNIAYVQVIFDKYFNLENNLVWYKPDSRTKKGIGIYRCFAPSTERILFYSNEVERTGLEMVDDLYIRHINPFSVEIKKGMEKYKLKESDFRKLRPSKNGNYTGWCSNIILGQSNPTKEDWELINTLIKSNREYEDLRREYEDLRRPFYNTKKLTDVMRYSQESHITRQFDHDTIKPERLTLDLIETTTKENDLVLIPFGGSGTECVCSMRLKRQWVAFENKKKYFDIGQKRINSEYEKTSLFNSLGKRQLQLAGNNPQSG